MSGIESLRAMFPDLDASVLQATLDAHDNSLERAVDYLLSSSASPADRERATQEARDEELARRLQAEDAAAHAHAHTHRGTVPPPSRAASTAAPQQAQGFAVPSLADVQSAVQPLVSGVAYAGRVAADSVSGLYRELVGEGGGAGGAASSERRAAGGGVGYDRDARDQEAVVLRGGEGSSPAAARSAARQRRPDASAVGRAPGDKKDD